MYANPRLPLLIKRPLVLSCDTNIWERITPAAEQWMIHISSPTYGHLCLKFQDEAEPGVWGERRDHH